jgi:tetratricopeptide (TPR) repeat protein
VELVCRYRRALAIVVFVAAAGQANAQQIPGYPAVEAYDPREVAMVPRYCIYTQHFRDRVPGGNDRATIDAWYARMGPVFHAMHHYCWGLMKTNRALLLARDTDTRRFYLGDAISEYDYVIQHSSDDFVLLPEILTKKGENLVRLGKGPQAIREFDRAMTLKPDYWPPYAHLSDYYRSTGDVAKARETLTRGLESAPDATALRRRLAELDVGIRGNTQRRNSP